MWGTSQTPAVPRATKAAQVFARDNSMIVRLNLVPAEGGNEALGHVTIVDASVDGEAMRWRR